MGHVLLKSRSMLRPHLSQLLTNFSLTENQNLVVTFYQLVADRFKENDFNGPTVVNILNVSTPDVY